MASAADRTVLRVGIRIGAELLDAMDRDEATAWLTGL
jgi:hypothetical protein